MNKHPRSRPNSSGKATLFLFLRMFAFALLYFGIGFCGGMLFSTNDQSPPEETVTKFTRDPRLEAADFLENTRLKFNQLLSDAWDYSKNSRWSLYQIDTNYSSWTKTKLSEMQEDWLDLALDRVSASTDSLLKKEYYQDSERWRVFFETEIKKPVGSEGGSAYSSDLAWRELNLRLRRIEQLKNWLHRFESEQEE